MFTYRSATVIRGVGCLAASLALFVSITSPLLAVTNGKVNVLTTVNTKVVAEATDGGVTVRGNTAWALYADTAQGTVLVHGHKTAGVAVPLPPGTTAYTIVAE